MVTASSSIFEKFIDAIVGSTLTKIDITDDPFINAILFPFIFLGFAYLLMKISSRGSRK
jgi:hypothetical protein